jgi:type I restriction enzyme S subunit
MSDTQMATRNERNAMNTVEHRLADVTEVVEATGPDPLRSEFVFVDLASVDPQSKRVAAPKRILVDAAPARARQRVRSGDVLVSTVRPNLNGVAYVPQPLDGAIASTGFAVLRARPELLDHRYLFCWVQSPAFIAEMTRLATGASVPAVSDVIVRSSAIPLPPLQEQRRIASVLGHADQLRYERRGAITLLDELADSFFLDAVDSSTEFGTVADLVESATYGTSAKTSSTRAVPVIRGTNITREGELDLADLSRVDLRGDELARFSVRNGDVLFFRTGSAESVARAAVFRGETPIAFPVNVIRVRPVEPGSAEYLATFLNSAYAKVALRNMATINPKNLLAMSLPLPSDAVQATLAQRVQDVRSVKSNERLQLARLDELYASLQHRAFSGRL